nr:hypothetical protein [Tanacetum cinerariifolium]
TSQHPEWFSQPRKPPTPDRDWNKTLSAIQGSAQTWISELEKQADSRSSFNELLDTPIDFSNFIMNWLCVDTLTPELLAGPTYKLMRGLCTSLTELEYHLEEVYKATTDQLDRVNPEESALDVYSKRRIIAVTDLKIVEWHNYKHLDWISICRDDDKIYKFKEGDFKRLRLQDIEDMLLLLVQEKLSNLTVEERFDFNVSLRMFTKIEPEIRTIEEVVPMDDRTMEELLQAPTKGYGEAIVIPEILAENFEIKTNLLKDVPNDVIKLMLFPYSPEGAARICSLAYEGASIPTNSPLEKVVERDTEEITDKEHSNYQGSTAHIQPLVFPISILEPNVPKTQPKPTIPYLKDM